MIEDIIISLATAAASNQAIEALKNSLVNYFRRKKLDERDLEALTRLQDDGGIPGLWPVNAVTKELDIPAFIRKASDDVSEPPSSEELRRFFEVLNIAQPKQDESPIEASRSTKEIIANQVTILEAERNRLIPIAAREHWVALIFVVIAGTVFFTSIGLFIFATLAKGIPTLVATAVPGFLSKVFFAREATLEKRLKEISGDLRESEKTKERLEILEEALKVIPEEHRDKVLNDFLKPKNTRSRAGDKQN